MSRFAPLAWLLQHPMTRRHPVRTIGRWCYWQVRQRVTSRPKIIPFIGGTRLEVHPHEGLTGYWYLTLPDYEEMSFLLRFLRQGDVFYDVGANAGAFAVLALASGCSVTAFEPVPKTFQRLQVNADLNREIGQVTTLNSAVGAAQGKLRMTTGLGTGNRVLRPDEKVPSVEVEMVTLDEVVGSGAHPTFIKIDVEGHELEVLRGAKGLLRSEALLGLLVETFRPHNWREPKLQAIEALLLEHGFIPHDYDPTTNCIRRLEKADDGGNNTFYFRQPELIEKRLNNGIGKKGS